MRKLTEREGFWLLYFMNGGALDDPYVINSTPEDDQSVESLMNLGYIDRNNNNKPLTKEGLDRCHFMLRYGINYDSHMKNVSLSSKRAIFLALINSNYEPRGLFPVLINKLSDSGFAQLKKAFFKRLNNKPNASNKSFNGNGPQRRSSFTGNRN